MLHRRVHTAAEVIAEPKQNHLHLVQWIQRHTTLHVCSEAQVLAEDPSETYVWLHWVGGKVWSHRTGALWKGCSSHYYVESDDEVLVTVHRDTPPPTCTG